MSLKRVPDSIIDDLLTSKKGLSEFIEGMGLCGEACSYYEGTTITNAAADTSQKAHWIMLFLTEMVGKSGWPTAKDLISDILSEIQNLSAYYSGHTWAEDAVGAIDDWVNDVITDQALCDIGKGHMKNKPYGVEEQKSIKIFEAIICACFCPERPGALVRTIELIAQAVHQDENKTNNFRQELAAITVRIGPSKYINGTITGQID